MADPAVPEPAERRAFEEFVRARSTALGRTAFLLTGDVHLAEDLLQQALVQAARRWERIEGRPEAYVRRILYTQNVSWWRARRHVREQPLEPWHDRPASADDVELRADLLDAMRRLTPRQRSVLVLRYVEDLTEAQVADVLGIRPGTVKSTAREAAARLRATAPHLDPRSDARLTEEVR
ncbi:SigE family RNA polymerase sigma factor [Nocardioides sp. TRM66260-LWL]|uniref:SigE family RNA polymerase sigma factor n=1 Tax=Nocardioides sp. TRM66260-LWL TaxID=2874478 RepID=UPI001CC34316|nr:SigE family RNA polymerase sigma factor [Nocardioides sp. TRM66260-LWL]MBZ5736327.1 SigE family RNA polymerase sigma factor [Nocardioides sp. TRM66260-LWL]